MSLILTPYTQYPYGHASICTTFSLNYHLVCAVLQLKPYVSFKTPEIKVKPITAAEVLAVVRPEIASKQ